MNAMATIAAGPRLRMSVLVAALAVAMLASLALGGTAHAATTTHCVSGQCGQHATTWSSCDVTLRPAVIVDPPEIRSSYVTYPANVFVWPNHTQWVGYRSWLLRYNPSTGTWGYTDQNRDGYADHGPLFQAQVVNGNLWDPPTSWYNVDAHQTETGSTRLPVTTSGYYRVRTQYYWYADQVSSAGYDLLDATSDYSYSTGVTVVSTPWCQFGV